MGYHFLEFMLYFLPTGSNFEFRSVVVVFEDVQGKTVAYICLPEA